MRSCTTFLGIVLFVACTVRASTGGSSASVDSLVGTVEVQRAGTQAWTTVAKGDHLRNNDYLRAAGTSFARLGWPDGSTSYVRENTQILLTIYEGGETNIISRHITVFYGAVFFVLKEILPKTLTKSYDVKIFTPTAVVSLRGTSLWVTVDKKSGSSTIEVTSGTVLVKNIIKNVSTFLSAGFKTTVELGTDPIVPKPILNDDFTALKGWVPAAEVERQMSEQLAKGKRDRNVFREATGEKILVMPFVNSSRYAGKWNVSFEIARMLVERLKRASYAAELADSASADPLALAEKSKAKFVITGEIQDFDIAQHAEIAPTADEYREFYLAQVRLALQLIDVSQKKVLIDNVFTGDMKGTNSKDNSWQKISALNLSDKDTQFVKSILGSALSQALEQSTEQLTRQVDAQ